MIFAAKEAVEKKARAKGLEEGLERGRNQERRRILAALERHGIELPPDLGDDLNGSGSASPRS